MVFATGALDGVSELDGSTVDRGVLTQSTSGLANLPTFIAGKKLQIHAERTACKTRGKLEVVGAAQCGCG